MILVDYTHVAISNIMQQMRGKSDIPVDPDLVRHMILQSILFYKRKFGDKYGKVVLCCDNRHYWRKKFFPHYKSSRRKSKAESPFDWDLIFKCLNDLKADIDRCFPFIVVEVETAEADDIIAVLAKTMHSKEPIMIISGDKDFYQLQQYPDVFQYRPVQKDFPRVGDPRQVLHELIMSGDLGDCIPNFLSDDDTFVANKRQYPIRKTDIQRWSSAEDPTRNPTWGDKHRSGYARNAHLIDFANIPQVVQDQIINTFTTKPPKTKQALVDYLVANRLSSLLERVCDFF